MNVSAAEFKAKCLKLIDEVADTHEPLVITPLVITKGGEPMAQLVPIEDETSASGYGYMRGRVAIHGEILAPGDEAWSAEAGDEDPLYTDLEDRSRRR
ncbi:antitoxin of toxin-antitoxin stability system [Thioflavicoccus mobilis 8321]|uniref:Antitoxin n=2 Tax=Thioflavicoccus mobilis TaxID=80679 RepID=L0GTF4_9GAMM|nr:antitoxin of toxin-antitoxin stability system [Thioflavicoccus mobilis 8321]